MAGNPNVPMALSLRDFVALISLIAIIQRTGRDGRERSISWEVEEAYRYADALLAAR